MDVSGECSICLESLKDETSLVRLTSCGHYFHRSCLDRIVEKNIMTCPLCRNPFSKIGLDEHTHPGVYEISPMIPFTYFMYSTHRPNNISPNTPLFYDEQSKLFKTTFCVGYVKIDFEHITLRSINANKKGEFKIPILDINKVVLDNSKYESQGMCCIQIYYMNYYQIISHVELLVANIFEEKKQIYNMIWGAMKGCGQECTEKTTIKTKNNLDFNKDLSNKEFDI